jgi:hypothetical protein
MQKQQTQEHDAGETASQNLRRYKTGLVTPED